MKFESMTIFDNERLFWVNILLTIPIVVILHLILERIGVFDRFSQVESFIIIIIMGILLFFVLGFIFARDKKADRIEDDSYIRAFVKWIVIPLIPFFLMIPVVLTLKFIEGQGYIITWIVIIFFCSSLILWFRYLKGRGYFPL